MAILKAPLLSIDARGQFGKSIVYLGWKGLKTARQHVTPANPKTAAQIAQRAKVTALVGAWKNYFTDPEGREAWNRWALNDARPMSGFNGFMSQAMGIYDTAADASFVNLMTEIAAQKINFTLLNMDDGVQGDEAGNYDYWGGSTISGMVIDEAVALVGGDLIGTTDWGDVDDVIYVKIRKGGWDRSGIFRAVLLAT